MACVDWEEGCFRQDQARRCAFLNPDNLCDLYKNVGKDALCKTCRDYPRHIEEFEDVRLARPRLISTPSMRELIYLSNTPLV